MTGNRLTINNSQNPLLKSIDDIINRARDISNSGEPYCLAVAAAHDAAVIDAAILCQKEGIARCMLFGKPNEIKNILEKHDSDASEFEIVAAKSDRESAEGVASAASSGKANVILKGQIKTSELLRQILKKEYGLRRKGLLSHVAMQSMGTYPKLLGITDGGMVIKPTFEQKIEIIRNAVLVSRAVGVEVPRVAVLSPIDYIVEAFPDTFEAAALSKMAERQQIKNCIVDGPMSFDTAIWSQAVEYQDIHSPVAGQADILVTSSIEEGNILAKSLIQFSNASFAGIILGARIPIALVSRADDAYNKLASVALAVVVAHFIRK